ncbi:hypothetical protein [Hyphomicrobium sp.]|uniref:hypothetical protein n=1 Tax=Hyphomicrobium sp. TaxID=82 RepID=UPI001D885CF2|nr:hypothetical protein [Hyphomicrobium sp.]MBY0561535.1 hypothetical protein [Hyphomicrobium sp.]
MKIFQLDIPVWATAYIKAKTIEEARQKARTLASGQLDAEGKDQADVPFSGQRFEDPDLPDVSVSPIMTIGPDDLIEKAIQGLYETEDLDDEEA